MRDPAQAGRFDGRLAAVMVVAALALVAAEYGGSTKAYEWLFPAATGGKYWVLGAFGWWASWRVIGYLVVPIVAIGCMTDVRFSDFHLAPIGFFRHLWIYGVLLLGVAPLVAIASQTDGFQDTYPFYPDAGRSAFDLWAWEVMYAAQFVALEVFFRGFLLAGLRRALGANAVFVAMVPYVMLHFGKPLPETLGAVVTGIVLGTLALRTRSIWGGVAIHITVAVSMDLMALASK